MTTGSLVVLVGMMLVSNRSNRRERLLLIIFVASVVRPVISGPPIPEQLRRRTLPPRRTPPVSTHALVPERARRFPVSASLHRKHAPAPLGQPGRSRSQLSGIGTFPASEFAFVYSAFLTWLLSFLTTWSGSPGHIPAGRLSSHERRVGETARATLVYNRSSSARLWPGAYGVPSRLDCISD
jgi:hypothetical protein